MRRSLLVLSLLGVTALAVHQRHHATPENQGALAVAILKDVTDTDGHGISWHAYGNAANATVWQHERAEFRGDLDNASVTTESWQVELSPSKIFGITCYVRGGEHGYPEYGFISFQPEHGDVFDALFTVGFDGGSIDALERLCAKHGIPVQR